MRTTTILGRTVAALLLAPTLQLTQVHAQGTVALDEGAHVNGGVGQEGREAMRAERKAYNLRLAFAQTGSGEYLSGLRVSVTPAGKQAELGPFEDVGPWFYIHLKPGRYRVSATYDGRTTTQWMQVGAGGADHVMYWPASKRCTGPRMLAARRATTGDPYGAL